MPGLFKARQLNDLMMSSSSTWHNEWSYTQHLSQSMLSSLRTQCSPMNNVPRASSFMRGDLSKQLLPECKLLPKESTCNLNSKAPILLQRMGLGNQLLMVRLGLLLKAPPSPT